MNNRGLSDVISTVLIILLVLAAVIIIWFFVRPFLNNVGGQVTGDCVTLNLEPLSCTNNLTGTSVQVKRNSGEANLKAIIYLFEVNGEDRIRNVTSSLQQLETTSDFLTSASIGGKPSKFTIAGIVETSSGNRQTCPQYDPKIACTG